MSFETDAVREGERYWGLFCLSLLFLHLGLKLGDVLGSVAQKLKTRHATGITW